MSDKHIKEYIRRYYQFHHRQKILINRDKMKFKIRMGDCESVIIEFPVTLKRELKIEKILNK